ncbi:MAG: energy transducer TonB [Verrucomicrobiota bacterium]
MNLSTAEQLNPLPTREYQLTSDLAQFCLPAAHVDENRKLAYANSVCFLFLLIGFIGIRPPAIVTRPPPQVTEIVPIVYTPPPEPVKLEPQPVPEEEPLVDEIVEAPQVATVVAADPSNVAFAIPVEGPVILAPAKFAAPPPPKPPPPRPVGPPRPVQFNAGAESGYFPDPPYLQDFIKRGYQGKIRLEFSVDASGTITSIEVKNSSGYPQLDNHVVKYVRDRWKFYPGPPRSYFKDFIYQLAE